MLSKSAKTAIFIVLVSKLLIFSVGYTVNYLNNGPPASSLNGFGDIFNRWDTSNYVSIAKCGYQNIGDEANYIVFFPLYPLLIRAFTWDFTYANLVAIIIANACSVIACIYLYKLTKLEFNESIAVKAVLFFSFFPTAYFLAVPYTEGLFFALIIAGFYYARLGNWAAAGTLGFFAALTRLAGLTVIPALLVEYFHQVGWKPKKMRYDVIFVFLALVGFLIYLGINNTVTGNPFTFMTIEATHWFNTFNPWGGLKGAWYWAWNKSFTDNITIGAAPIAFAIFGLVMIGVGLWKRIRPTYIVFMFFAWGLAVSTSWWISVPRYIMAMFPMYMLLGGLTKNKAVNAAIVIFSAILLCFFTALFTLGWWAF